MNLKSKTRDSWPALRRSGVLVKWALDGKCLIHSPNTTDCSSVLTGKILPSRTHPLYSSLTKNFCISKIGKKA